MIWKMCFLVNFKILEVFLKTLTADHKYPVWDCKNLPFRIYLILLKKRKSLPQFFVPFLELAANFKHFKKREGRHS